MHRIDRETSGLVMFAKSREATTDPIIDKKYFAVVKGSPTPTAGVVKAAIDWNYNRGFLSEEGKEAVTYYKTLSIADSLSLVEFKLATGRKHQIRVHAKHFLNTPIIGDKIYGGPAHEFMLLHSNSATVKGTVYHASLPCHFTSFCESHGLSFESD